MVKLILVTAMFLISACGSEYPWVGEGGRIAGKIRYQGTAIKAMRRPALRISAATTFPPVGQPHAILIADPPGLENLVTDPGPGLDYELRWLPAYQYKVTAQIVDLDNTILDYSVLPLGGFPDYCMLPRPEEGLVTVTKDAPTLGTDFVIYDLAGSNDICTREPCPKVGKATMFVVVKSSRKVTKRDRLRVVLFQNELDTQPASLRIVLGDNLTFPQVVADNNLPPGRYALANACLDIDSDSGTDRCTDKDVQAVYHAPPSPPLEFPANRIVHLTADLDAETITLDKIEDPREQNCK